MVIPVKTPTKRPEEGKTEGTDKKSIPPKSRQTAKRRSVLEVEKYGPVESAKWKRVNARFPVLYKALLIEPGETKRGAWLRRAVSKAE